MRGGCVGPFRDLRRYWMSSKNFEDHFGVGSRVTVIAGGRNRRAEERPPWCCRCMNALVAVIYYGVKVLYLYGGSLCYTGAPRIAMGIWIYGFDSVYWGLASRLFVSQWARGIQQAGTYAYSISCIVVAALLRKGARVGYAAALAAQAARRQLATAASSSTSHRKCWCSISHT